MPTLSVSRGPSDFGRQPTHVLVIEDSRFFTSVLRKGIQERLGLSMVHAESRAQTREILNRPDNPPFLAALVDLNLPDAPTGEVIEDVVAHGLPIVVFTGTFNDEIREYVLSHNVVDYVTKDTPTNVEQVLYALGRLTRNPSTTVLVVDDSRVSRHYLENLLINHRFSVLSAASGAEALEVLEQHPEVRLAICDFNMEGMDGCQLTKNIRRRFPRDRMAIIGISAYGNNLVSAQFMKAGASDYLNKPFLQEELFCRVYQNIELLERIDALRATADTLKSAKERADSANAFKTRFLSGLSHELRTPLGAIIGYTELLSSGLAGVNAEEFLGHIGGSAQHMLSLVEDLLDISAIETGHLALHEEPTDLALLISEVEAMLRPKASDKGVTLGTPRDMAIPPLQADPRRLRQVLLNLLGNALKFTPEGGSVELMVSASSAGLVLTVLDSGCGMGPDDIAMAMTQFGQIAQGQDSVERGWGLGLPLSKGLVEMHGGSLAISSTPGQGTAVTVVLPAARFLPIP